MAMAALLAFLLLVPAIVNAAYCHGAPSPGAQPNLLPIVTADLVLINSTANGKLYQVGSGEDLFHVLHMFGTPYEMGYAHGVLLREQLQEFIPTLYAYLATQAQIPDLPTWLSNILVTEGAEAALLATAYITKKYTPDYWFQEMQGLSDGSGIAYDKILELHMIGELTKGACSMFGAWGSAIPAGDSLVQLRALDWDTTGPYKNVPLISVYHPQTGNGHAFATIGFMGWIGGLSGMSSTPMGVSEIGVSFPDPSFGEESRFGYPFTFLIRDILQFDEDLDSTISRLGDAARTCDLILGAGDGNMKTFRSFEYSFSTLKVIDDVNLLPVNDTWHQPIENVVYHGMDWLCPAYNLALYTQLSKFHGNITAENTIRYITPIVETGSLHIGVYDFTRMLMYVSFAASDSETGPLDAWARTFTQLNMTEIFAEQPPSML